MPDKKKLFFLDAFALIFRGYYAMIKNPRINSKGMDTSAILGFVNSLTEILRKEQPEYLAVVFDKGGSEKRSALFTQYKANRLETPESIQIAVPYIKAILGAMRIAVVEKEGYEADDLIGTLSKKAEKENFNVYMVTPDKDYAQLVSDNIFMYRPARMGNGIEIWDTQRVKEKFEVAVPLQVIDYLAMVGDPVDNIPGLPGVGDKTAKKFIKTYGSLENLLAHTHELKGKLGEKVQSNKALGLLSKKLTTIILDAPVSFIPSQYKIENPTFEKLVPILEELEFKRALNTIENLYKNQNEQTPRKNNIAKQLDLFAQTDLAQETKTKNAASQTQRPFFQYLDQPLGHKILLKYLLREKKVALHFLTSESSHREKSLLAIGFAYGTQNGYYAILGEQPQEKKEILALYKPFFENENILKIGENIKDMIKILKAYTVDLKGDLFDITLAHYLLQPESSHKLKILAKTFLKKDLLDKSDLLGSGKNKLSAEQISIEDKIKYTIDSAQACFSLQTVLEKKLEQNKLTKLYKTLEIPVLKVLAKMEGNGIAVDSKKLKNLSENLAKEIQILEQEIYRLSETAFNIASPKQLGQVLFEKMKLVQNPKKTKTGQYTTSEEVLSKLKNKHVIIEKILQYRTLVKLKNTYVDVLPKEVAQKTQRIHTTYMQTVTATGRLSSVHPNLQNIPIRTQKGQQIRDCFVAQKKDTVLLAADYSQIELRLIAAMSKEQNMLTSFENKEDIHIATAAQLFKVPVKNVTPTQRAQAKSVNFGILYGQGAAALSEQTGITKAQARDLIENYYKTYPRLKKYMQKQIEQARSEGYVTTLLGRKRYLNNINSANGLVRSADERNAVNTPIQGSAADLIKKAMIVVDKALCKKKLQTKMLLQVHDELVFEVPKNELDWVQDLIREAMENIYDLPVALKVDIGTGHSWLAAH